MRIMIASINAMIYGRWYSPLFHTLFVRSMSSLQFPFQSYGQGLGTGQELDEVAHRSDKVNWHLFTVNRQ